MSVFRVRKHDLDHGLFSLFLHDQQQRIKAKLEAPVKVSEKQIQARMKARAETIYENEPTARGDYAITLRDQYGDRTFEYEAAVIPVAISKAQA